MEEYFDVLNNKGDYTGKIESREKCHKEGLWHKAVAVFVINSKGQVLLQRRSPNKKMWPNMWDITAGGHVLSGEFGFQSIIRECKEEIGIMKLIGATNFFVRAPFLIEGMIIGLIGAIIPLVLLFVMYKKVIEYVLTKFSMLSSVVQFMSVTQVFEVLTPVALILGMGIGLFGSVITIRKHLRV